MVHGQPLIWQAGGIEGEFHHRGGDGIRFGNDIAGRGDRGAVAFRGGRQALGRCGLDHAVIQCWQRDGTVERGRGQGDAFNLK